MDQEKAPLLAENDGYFPRIPSEYERAVAAQEQARLRSRRRRRVWGHIAGIIVLFFLVKAILHRSLHPGERFHWSWSPPLDGSEESEWPIPPELTVQHCVDWPQPEFDGPRDLTKTFTSTFELPISSALLFLTSRGPLSVGHVDIVQSDEEGDSAVVKVTTGYSHPRVLELVHLCRVVADDGEDGVGIFSVRGHHRRRRHRHHHVFFDITVTLPKGSDDSPIEVSNFETRMGLFGHHVADLADSVYFKSISLNAALKPIQVESLTAGTASLETANSPIDGNFNTRESLKLSTVNAHINVSVNMFNEKSEERSPSLQMNTANAPIHASVSLLSTESGEARSSDGKFDIKAHTAKGAVNVTIPTAPVNSTVVLQADTAVAPVDVTMHPTYEGTFRVHAGPFDTKTVVAEEADDPEGRGRERKVITDSQNAGTLEGHVSWDEHGDGKARGSVTLNTVVGHVLLKL